MIAIIINGQLRVIPVSVEEVHEFSFFHNSLCMCPDNAVVETKWETDRFKEFWKQRIEYNSDQ